MAVQHCTELRSCRYPVRAAGKAGLHPADHQEQEEYARHERDERRAPAAAEEVREQPCQAQRGDAEAV